MKKLILLAVVLLAGGAAAFTVLRPKPVVATRPTRGPAVHAVYATGEVEPLLWAKVSPIVTAQIKNFFANEGQPIRSGELLAILDDREVRARVQQLDSKEKLQRSEVDRQYKLFKGRSTSEEEYDRSVRNHEQASYELDAQKAMLSNYELRSPIDGMVLRRDGEIGEIALKERTIFWVGQASPLLIEAEVDEESIPLIKSGQKAAITADAFPGQALAGTVERITPLGDPEKKTFRVKIFLPPDTPLQIGMTTEVNIVVREESNALLIPGSAVVRDNVWVVSGSEAKKRAIKVDFRGDGRIAVRSGLTAEDIVVLNPTEQMPESFPVKTVELAPQS